MAKQSYKIPTGLNTNRLDMEISLTKKGGDNPLARPLPARQILFYVAAGLVGIFIIFRSGISGGSLVQKLLFAAVWVGLAFFLGTTDKSGRMRIQLLPSLVNYLSSRKVATRAMDSASGFYSVVGIDSVSDDGLILWGDGFFGTAYRVVGSASVLLFDGDRTAILDKADGFYRKVGTDCEMIFITTKEPQRVARQVGNLANTYEALTARDEDLLACMEEQFWILKEYVGKEFHSIHQYMILRAPSKEQLKQAEMVVRSEAENSGYVFKKCERMDGEAIQELLHIVYSAGGDNIGHF